MDPGASAEITIGNNMMARAEQNALALTQKKRGIQQDFDKERRGAGTTQTESEGKDVGEDVLSGGGTIGNVSRVTESIGKASAKAQASRQFLKDAVAGGQQNAEGLRRITGLSTEESAGMTTDEIIQKGTAGPLRTFIGAEHQLGEAGAEVDKIGDLITQARTGVLRAGGTEGAGVGIPAIVSGIAKKVNVGTATADAVGDLVGHGIGLGMAGVSGIEDIAGGWSKMDTGEKWGNALGIAGGIVDTAGAFAPVLAPVGVALDVSSAIANWIGDSQEQKFKEKTTINPAQAKADKDATSDAGTLTAESVTSTGQVAMGGPQSIATRTY